MRKWDIRWHHYIRQKKTLSARKLNKNREIAIKNGNFPILANFHINFLLNNFPSANVIYTRRIHYYYYSIENMYKYLQRAVYLPIPTHTLYGSVVQLYMVLYCSKKDVREKQLKVLFMYMCSTMMMTMMVL